MTYDPVEHLDQAIDALRAGQAEPGPGDDLPPELQPLLRAGAELQAAAARRPDGSPRPAFVLALEEQLRTDLRLQAAATQREAAGDSESATLPADNRGPIGVAETATEVARSAGIRITGFIAILVLLFWGANTMIVSTARGTGPKLGYHELGGKTAGGGVGQDRGVADGAGLTGGDQQSAAHPSHNAAGTAVSGCEDCFRWDQVSANRREALRSDPTGGAQTGSPSGTGSAGAGRSVSAPRRQPGGSVGAGSGSGGTTPVAVPGAEIPPAVGTGGDGGNPDKPRHRDPEPRDSSTPEPPGRSGGGDESGPPTPTPDCWTCNVP